jgi:hypothetical protein
MAKLRKSSDDVIEFVEKILTEETLLENYITWRILSNDKQKQLIQISKSSAITEYFAQMRDSVIIIINEELFDALAPQHEEQEDVRKLIIEDALSTIICETNEKSGEMKIAIGKPQICITTGCYEKYGEKLVRAAEISALAYNQLIEMKKKAKEEEQAAKAAKKAEKNKY